jgi:restriction system protein
MPIPDYQTIMLPLLRYLGNGEERSMSEAIEAVSNEFDLTPQERLQLLPSGTSTIIGNRVAWARTYMKKAGLLESPKRGVVRITKRGSEVLKTKPLRVDVKFLDQYPEFIEFRTIRHDNAPPRELTAITATPEEALEEAYDRLRRGLESELLQRVMGASPAFFERLVIDLLVKMGYGGSFRDAGQAIGKSGDGGIDGIIKEDRLGLDVIYIQAKRWEGSVGRPEIQKFAGALQGHRARKGVFMTTSTFSKDAYEFVERIDSKIVLIDGAKLARFMVDSGVGVSLETSYEVQRVDSDYFTEDQ